MSGEWEFHVGFNEVYPGTLIQVEDLVYLVIAQWLGESQSGTYSREACEEMIPDQKIMLLGWRGTETYSQNWHGAFRKENFKVLRDP